MEGSPDSKSIRQYTGDWLLLMMSIANTMTGSKQALILISAILVISIVDSQFINTFYGTDLDIPWR